MQVVFEQKNYLPNMILGEQDIEYNCTYRLLNFCIKTIIDDNVLLYNNMTKKIVLLSNAEIAELENTEIIFSDKIICLIKEWFLVPQKFDECKLYDQLYDTVSQYNNFLGITQYTILTTTDCNARCYYCYEKGISKRNMDNKTAEDVAKFILKNYNGHKVRIKWFGGEPLYNLKAIDVICNILKENQVEYVSTMVTNGYLLDENILEKASSLWNLTHVQITLDGTEEKYNRIKSFIYKDGESPFKVVVKNIKRIANLNYSIDIRLNVSKENKDNIYELVRFLSQTFDKRNNINVYASNLYDNDNDSIEDTEQRINEFFSIDDFLYDNRMKKAKLYTQYNRGCMAQNDHAVVISPEGLLGRCEHFSEGNMMYGSIYSNEINSDSKNYWMEFYRLDECKMCPIYPNCFGITHCPSLSNQCIEKVRPIKMHNIIKSIHCKYYEYVKRTQSM